MRDVSVPAAPRLGWPPCPARGSCGWSRGACRTWRPRGCRTPGNRCWRCPASSGHVTRRSSSCRSPRPSSEVWWCLSGRERAVSDGRLTARCITRDGAALTWDGIRESVGMFCHERVLDVSPADAVSSCRHHEESVTIRAELEHDVTECL